MADHKNLANLLEEMPPIRHARSAAPIRDARLKIRQEMFLADLRKHSGMTQKELAEKLGIAQPSLSQMEGQEDMQISTLLRLVDSLGGKLELVVQMPSGEVILNQFSDEKV